MRNIYINVILADRYSIETIKIFSILSTILMDKISYIEDSIFTINKSLLARCCTIQLV